jgi:hypothetical protein
LSSEYIRSGGLRFPFMKERNARSVPDFGEEVIAAGGRVAGLTD